MREDELTYNQDVACCSSEIFAFLPSLQGGGDEIGPACLPGVTGRAGRRGGSQGRVSDPPGIIIIPKIKSIFSCIKTKVFGREMGWRRS